VGHIPRVWLHYVKVALGTYSFDAKTGTITVKGSHDASLDAKTGILMWRERTYAPVKDAIKGA
jgi:hypothetical protein